MADEGTRMPPSFSEAPPEARDRCICVSGDVVLYSYSAPVVEWYDARLHAAPWSPLKAGDARSSRA